MFCFAKDKILLPVQLKKLTDHTYKCESTSFADSYLQPFWNWLVTQTPIWIAPNLITLIGLIVNIVTTLLIIRYSPDATSDVSPLTVYRNLKILRLVQANMFHWGSAPNVR